MASTARASAAAASGESVEAGVGRSAMRGEYGIRADVGRPRTILVPMADLQGDRES